MFRNPVPGGCGGGTVLFVSNISGGEASFKDVHCFIPKVKPATTACLTFPSGYQSMYKSIGCDHWLKPVESKRCNHWLKLIES